ncbi:YggT family protein [Candidatus Liberibacter brunswickensis]|uniref:YggT family protein n=1 Tax=Candidatus Liberibacter brunswickensis TaxID=1968796 RepID=UPI002FDF3854
MNFLFKIMHLILELYFDIIIMRIVISFLYRYNILNTYNLFVKTAREILYNSTEPLLSMVRRIIPFFGINFTRIDLSPIISLMAIYILQLFLKLLIS